MKRFVMILAVAGLIMAVGSLAQAAVVTLQFDPNDLIDLYPADSSGLKATQVDARRLHHERWGSTIYNTFSDAMATGHTQSEDYNTYLNWRDSLGENEGIAMFNMWFLDNPLARSWGESTVVKPGTTVTATAAGDWNYRIIHNAYGLGGDTVQWWTTDQTKLLRPGGADIGEFSITADLYHDTNEDGWDASDPDVQFGETVRFWAGLLNGDDADFYRSDTQAVYYDADGWGTRDTYAGFTPSGAYYSSSAVDYGSGFEAALSATAIPEPASVLVWCLLGAGSWLGMRVWRRRRIPVGQQPWSAENRQAIHEIIAR
ncbi:MAG: hypothetical protein K8R46_11790 [Pirellulales bacterium]|nr:hypothetical protein [Pirellulales bacterium]